MLVLIIGILSLMSPVIGQSVINVFPTSPLDDPFYDPYTDTIIHLNRSALMSISRMDDNTFLQSLRKPSPTRTYRKF